MWSRRITQEHGLPTLPSRDAGATVVQSVQRYSRTIALAGPPDHGERATSMRELGVKRLRGEVRLPGPTRRIPSLQS